MTVAGLSGVPGSLKAVRNDLAGVLKFKQDLDKLPERGFVPGGEDR
jgi:hypothetical protein